MSPFTISKAKASVTNGMVIVKYKLLPAYSNSALIVFLANKNEKSREQKPDSAHAPVYDIQGYGLGR